MSKATKRRGRPREMKDPVTLTIRVEMETLRAYDDQAKEETPEDRIPNTSRVIRRVLEAAVEDGRLGG